MGIFYSDRPGPGIEKDAPSAKGLRQFFQILFREFFSLIKVSCLFLLFSLPVITFPAAYCAMTRITASMVRDRPYFLCSDFWNTFRTEFKKATAAGLLVFGSLVAALIAVWFYCDRVERNFLYCLPAGIAGMGAVILTFAIFSLFPMIALLDLPLKHVLKNALLLAAMSYINFIPALVVCVFILLSALWFFPISLPLLLLVCPALLNLITTFCAYGRIERYVLAQGAEPEEM